MEKMTCILLVTATLVLLSCTSRKATVKHTVGLTPVQTDIPYFLFLSDVHLVDTQDTTECKQDAGTDLWKSTQSKIKSMLKGDYLPAFILYTGDLPQHESGSTKNQRQSDIITMLSDLASIVGQNKIPLFYLPGNNDVLTGDYCLYSDDPPLSLLPGYYPYPYKQYNVDSILRPITKGAYMLSSATDLAKGYYAAHIMKGLRIIALNSIIWSKGLAQSWACPQDTALQRTEGDTLMQWFGLQLRMAKDAGEKVFIAMHIPPGVDAFGSRDISDPEKYSMMWGTSGDGTPWQNQFLDTISLYQPTVAGIFYGHTHMDEFRILYDSLTDQAMQVAISCPGISARSSNNPGFKTVKFDGQSMLPTDFTTYYTMPSKTQWDWSYNFSTFSGQKPGVSIYEQLKSLTGKGQPGRDTMHSWLDSMYTVKSTCPKLPDYKSYDMKGVDVKNIVDK